MKKLLSILLTLCLLIAVTVIPVPAMAATGEIMFDYGAYGVSGMPVSHTIGTAIDYPELPSHPNGVLVWSLYDDVYEEPPAVLEDDYLQVYVVLLEGVFNFESYSPNKYIGMSGRVAPVEEADGNTVIKFDNNGIPYRTSDIDASNSYTKNADGTYTKVTNPDANAYASYYHASARLAVFKSNKAPYDSMEMYNAIDLNLKLETSTSYKITINYKRENLVNALYVHPVTWCKSANQRPNLTAYDEGRITIPVTDTADSDYVTVSTMITTPEAFNTSGTNGKYVGDTLRLVLYTGFVDANNVVYFDDIKVEKLVGTVTYVIPEGATVNGKNGSVTVGYAENDTITFPEVDYAEGYSFDSWIDTETGAAVENPVLGGNYTLVVKEPVEMVTITLNRGGVTQEVEVEKGKEFTLPDTEFTDTSWWSNEVASSASRFVGYEGEKVTVTKDITYYTAETYAKGSGANMYKNWTVVDDATEGLTYLRKTMVDTETATAWAHGASTRLCTRLGVIEDGNTYKISVTYKAETNTPLDFVMVISAVNNPAGAMRSYLEETKAFHTVSEDTNGWTTATFYITADSPAEVTANNNGLDDTKDTSGYEGLYLMVNKDAGAHNVDIAIKETKVVDLGKVVEAKGASVLTVGAAAEAGSQAMRYYFDYKTAGDGTTITIDGTDYTVVERGFLYANGDIKHYAAAGVEGTATPPAADPDKYNLTGKYFVNSYGNDDYGYSTGFQMWLQKAKDASGKGLLTYRGVSGDALLKKWNLENNTLTFSTYITNIAESAYNAKFMVRGYVIFEDENGVEHTIYSKTTNRSVNGIIDALAERHE